MATPRSYRFAAGRAGIGGLLWVLTVLTTPGGCFDLPTGELPENRREAAELLATGTLDSAQWEALAPFYQEPLSVPLGELRYLRDVVPWLPEGIPVSTKELSRYEPWSPEHIDTFFMDYPSLSPFRPVLSFAIGGLPHMGAVSFTSSSAGGRMLSRHVARLRLTPADWLGVDGAVRLGRDHARWGRRRVRTDLPVIGELEAGNVSFVMNEGLFYGYFPADTATQDNAGGSWRYGGEAAWNGVHSRTVVGRRGRLELLYHDRPTESVWGGLVSFDPPGAGVASIGLSRLRTFGPEVAHGRSVAAHAGGTLPIGSWRLRLHAGVDIARPRAVPVLVELGRNRRRLSMSVMTTLLPSGFYAPRSRLAQSMRRTLDLPDTLDAGVLGLRTRMRNARNPVFGPGMELSYVTAGPRGVGEAVLFARGTAAVDYRIRYGLSVDGTGGDARHRGYCSVAWRPAERIELALDSRAYRGVHGYWSVSGEFAPSFTVRGGMRISPSVTVLAAEDGRRSARAGLEYTLLLFEKTFGELALHVPIGTEDEHDVTVRTEAHFLF